MVFVIMQSRLLILMVKVESELVMKFGMVVNMLFCEDNDNDNDNDDGNDDNDNGNDDDDNGNDDNANGNDNNDTDEDYDIIEH
jgi:hypothetical protein